MYVHDVHISFTLLNLSIIQRQIQLRNNTLSKWAYNNDAELNKKILALCSTEGLELDQTLTVVSVL